jgi:hypothetical protein
MKTAILAAVLAGLALGGCQTNAQRADAADLKMRAVGDLRSAGKITHAESARRQAAIAKEGGTASTGADQAYWALVVVNATKRDQGLMTKEEADASNAEANAVRDQRNAIGYAAYQASRPRTCIRTDDFVNCF